MHKNFHVFVHIKKVKPFHDPSGVVIPTGGMFAGMSRNGAYLSSLGKT